MLSALKKKLGSGSEPGGSGSTPNGNPAPAARMPAGIRAMDAQLQRKFARGIQYNSEQILKLNSIRKGIVLEAKLINRCNVFEFMFKVVYMV